MRLLLLLVAVRRRVVGRARRAGAGRAAHGGIHWGVGVVVVNGTFRAPPDQTRPTPRAKATRHHEPNPTHSTRPPNQPCPLHPPAKTHPHHRPNALNASFSARAAS